MLPRAKYALLAAAMLSPLAARAADPAATAFHVNLRSGFDVTCARMEPIGEKTRLYLHEGTDDYMDVSSRDIVSAEVVNIETERPTGERVPRAEYTAPPVVPEKLTLADLTATAGIHNNLDAELIAAVVKQESSGNPHAISRAGARGLMQLMPGTAQKIGVSDSFDPSQNVEGGTAYLNNLLLRYHDNLALALAAYNAGPGAVDKYHGVPPYRETRAYVARIIHDFNRRKALLARSAVAAAPANLAAGILR